MENLKSLLEIALETPIPEAQTRYENALINAKRNARTLAQTKSTYDLAISEDREARSEVDSSLTALNDCINAQN